MTDDESLTDLALAWLDGRRDEVFAATAAFKPSGVARLAVRIALVKLVRGHGQAGDCLEEALRFADALEERGS